MEIVITFEACAALKSLFKMVIFELSHPWNFQKIDRYEFSLNDLDVSGTLNLYIYRNLIE